MLGDVMSGGTNKSRKDAMNIPYEKWGREKTIESRKDANGNNYYIEDYLRSVQEPETYTVTKKQVLDDIDGWRMDDGSYGDGDVKIYLAYKDGTFVDADDLNGKKYKKSGIIGASISTGDYEMVWGGELDRNGRFVQWQTWSEDGESGQPNSYSGYKTVAVYMERVKTRFVYDEERDRYKTVRTVIRRSTKKKVKW